MNNINFFIIWGHCFENLENVLNMMYKEKLFEIIKIIKMKQTNIEISKVIYLKDGLDKCHIINKMNYLKNHDKNNPFLVIIRHKIKDYEKIKEFKWKIREKFNPKDPNKHSKPLSKGISHHHVVHFSDYQDDFIELQRKFPTQIKNLNYYLFYSPKSIFDNNNYIVKKVLVEDLKCSVIGVNEHIPIQDTPHYKYLLNDKNTYNKYIMDNLGVKIKDYHLSEKYDELIKNFEYGKEIDNFKTYIFCKKNYVIVDGLHRACIFKYKNLNKYINVYLIT